MIIILHPEEKIRYIGILETLAALGSSIAPVFGSFLYAIFGYFTMFLVLGIILFALMLVTRLTIPINIDENDSMESLNKGNIESNAKSVEKINYQGLFSE